MPARKWMDGWGKERETSVLRGEWCSSTALESFITHEEGYKKDLNKYFIPTCSPTLSMKC